MPQLLSRADENGWVTPAAADVGVAPAEKPYDAKYLYQQANLIQRRFAELSTPVRIVDVRASPSHLRFFLRPAMSGQTAQLGGLIENLRPALPGLLRNLEAELVELYPAQKSGEGAVLLVRPQNPPPLSLDFMLGQENFLNITDPTALSLGLSLNQQTIVRDLRSMPHLLIVGDAPQRHHLMSALILQLCLFNTPAEFRFALIGARTDIMDALAQSPHILGGTLHTLKEFRRLLDGLIKHLGQRKNQFNQQNAKTLDEYNESVKGQSQKPFPRLLITLDAVSLKGWGEERQAWFSNLYRLVKEGPALGLHVVLAVPDLQSTTVPNQLLELMSEQMILRSAFNTVNWAQPPASFPIVLIDSMYRANGSAPQPIELPEVDNKQIGLILKYWRRVATLRNTDSPDAAPIPPTGLTGYLRRTGQTGALLAARQQREAEQSDASLSAAILAEVPAIIKAERDTKPDLPVVDENTPPVPRHFLLLEKKYRRAGALAAYLGWLSIGPLIDVLEQSPQDARATLKALQEAGLLEAGESPMLRFMRLSEEE